MFMMFLLCFLYRCHIIFAIIKYQINPSAMPTNTCMGPVGVRGRNKKTKETGCKMEFSFADLSTVGATTHKHRDHRQLHAVHA